MTRFNELKGCRVARLIAAFAIAGGVSMAGAAWGAPKPVPIQVKQTSAMTFGSPITVSWTLKNTTATSWAGSFVFNVDSNAVSPLDQPNNVSIVRGATKSGIFTFTNPGPGVHTLSVTFIDTIGVGDAGASTIAKPIDPSQLPQPVEPPTKPVGPNIKILASGAIKFQGSEPASQIGSSNMLSEAQKNLMLEIYAPLMLFSYDHDSQEKYAPIDVLDFIKASHLQSDDSSIASLSQAVLQDPSNLLQAPAASIDWSGQTPSALARHVYLTPSDEAQAGTPWPQVMAAARSGNPVGMYGHVTLETVANVTDSILLPPGSPFNNVLQQELAERYGCAAGSSCNAQIIKIEYWQFFGFSHDFENPGGPLTNLFGPNTSQILAALFDHSGDWCTVEVYVDAAWAFSNRPDRAVLAVYHAVHGVQIGFDMAQATGNSGKTVEGFAISQIAGPNFGRTVDMNVKAGETDSAVQAAQNNVVQFGKDPASGLFVHPVVYVEWGGHEFFPTSDWSYKYASKHNGTGKYHYIANGVRNLGEIGNPTADYPQAKLITDFAGYWGNTNAAVSQNGPPQGPTLHRQWFWDPNAVVTKQVGSAGMSF
jgi:hypothetical protein